MATSDEEHAVSTAMLGPRKSIRYERRLAAMLMPILAGVAGALVLHPAVAAGGAAALLTAAAVAAVGYALLSRGIPLLRAAYAAALAGAAIALLAARLPWSP